jgi:hypothetical protein
LAEQNLLLQSQTFNTSWTLNASTLTANSIVAPDGTTTGYTLTNDTSTSAHGVYQAQTTTTGYTYSIYAKTGTTNYLGITNTSNVTLYSGAVFDLTAGSVSSSQNCTASIVSVGNGWYRCIVANNTTYSGSYFIASVLESAINPWTAYAGTTKNIYIWGAQLEQRSSVTAYNATTTAIVQNYIPQLMTAAINAARFDYNPTTRAALGLLIEQSSTNLLTYSQLFNNVAWNNNGGSVSINTTAGIAPDGTQTANLVTESTGTIEHHIAESYTFSASTAYTASIYIKQVYGSRNIRILFYTNSAADQATVIFNASTGAVVSAASAVGSMTAVSATATLLGNGFWRFTLTGTTSATAGGGAIRYQMMSGTTASYTGDGWSSLYYWGAQLEALAFPTSYIPTTSAQVTRASDNASMTGTNFSSWYNQGQGTLYVNSQTANATYGASGNYYASISDGTVSNGILIANVNGLICQIKNNANTTLNLTYVGSLANINAKGAVSYINGSGYFAYNGTVSSQVTTTVVPSVNSMQIGNRADSSLGTQANGWIKKISYYPQALTSAQLQALTGS